MSERKKLGKVIDNIFKSSGGYEPSDSYDPDEMDAMSGHDFGFGGEIDDLHQEVAQLRSENAMIFNQLNEIEDRLTKTNPSNSDTIKELQNEIGKIKDDLGRILALLSESPQAASARAPAPASAQASASFSTPLAATDTRLEARILALERIVRASPPEVPSTASPLPSAAETAPSVRPPLPSGPKGPKTGKTRKPTEAPSVPSPVSATAASAASVTSAAAAALAAPAAPASAPATASSPSTATPAASAPGAATVGGSPWVVVDRKKRKATPLSSEVLKASPDPLGLLLAKTSASADSTREVMVTHLTIPLSTKAQYRPYLAWRTTLKTVTGLNPLNIVLVHPRRAIVFWDVSDVSRKVPILRALDGRGFLKLPADGGPVGDHLYLRAYLGGYFKLLRQAALKGLPVSTITWVFDKAQEHWRKSRDKVRKYIWLKRIAWDREAFARGEKVEEGMEPSLDPARPDMHPGAVARPPCVTSDGWMAEAIYLIREQAEARRLETESAAPPGEATKMEEG